MFSIRIALCNYRDFPSSLHNRCVRISVSCVSSEAEHNAEPCLVRDVQVPVRGDEAQVRAGEHDPRESDEVELDDSVAVVEVAPCPWADESGESRRRSLELVIAVSLVLPRSSDASINSKKSSLAPLLGQCRLIVPVWSLCHIDKVRGYSAGTPAGIVGLMVSVCPNDRASFARRLTTFFEAVNPKRLEGIPAILASPDVDEIMIFSKLHEKYHAEVPEFSAKGSFLDRVARSFDLYDLGTSRAAAALLNEWKGRELDLIARLACQHGPEPSDIPVTMRLAAFCGEHALHQDAFRSLLQAAVPMSAAQREDLFRALRSKHGAEPDPSRYLFPPLLRSDDILSAFGPPTETATDTRGEHRSDREQQSSSPASRLHEYLGVQFVAGTGSAAYSHLRETEQSLSTMRSLQATSEDVWPLSVETNPQRVSPLSHRASQGSFVYAPSAQNAVVHGTSARDAGKRAPTMAERESAQAASERIARDASVQHTVPLVIDHISTSAAASQRSAVAPPATTMTEEGEQHPSPSVIQATLSKSSSFQSRSGEDQESRSAAMATVRRGSRTAAVTTPLSSGATASVGAPEGNVVFSNASHRPPVESTLLSTSVPHSSSVRTVTDAAAPAAAAADPPRWVVAPRPMVTTSTQVNIWHDLDPSHREEFIYGDPYSPQCAWASFQATFEATHRIPFHRLWFLSEDELQRLATEMDIPADLQRIIAVERKSMTLFHTTVQCLPPGHPERAQVLRRVVSCSVEDASKKPTCTERSFVTAGLVYAVLNATHAAVFEQHRARHEPKRAGSVQLTGDSQNLCRQPFSSGVERPLSVPCVVDAVYVSASALHHRGNHNDLLDILAFGFPQRPARFYRHFTSAVRHAYRELVASSVSTVVPPLLRDCPLDVLLCRVLVGHNVLASSAPDAMSSLPVEFDSAIVSAGDADNESWLVFDRQWILPVAWLAGACVDPDAAVCVNHPDAPALYRSGGGLDVLTRDVRASLTTAQLLEMQSMPPLCVSCLAVRCLSSLPSRPPDSVPRDGQPEDVVNKPTVVAEESTIANESFPVAGTGRSSRSPSARHNDGSHSHPAPPATAVAAPGLPTFRSDGDMFAAAMAHLRSGKTTECYRLLHLLPQMFPNTSCAAEAEGLLSELVDRHFVRAALHYREACRRNPLSVSTLYRLANLLETRLDRADEAFQVFQRAAQLGDPLSAKRALALQRDSRHHNHGQNDGNGVTTPMRSGGGATHVNHTAVKALQPPVGRDAVYIPSAERPRSRLF